MSTNWSTDDNRRPDRKGRLSARGRALFSEIQAVVAGLAGPLFADLPEADVAATTRVLNEVLARARAVLS